MKKLYICVCFLLFIYSPVHAGEIVDISPDIEKLLENSLVPSLSVAAVVDGKIIAAGAAGIRKKGSPEKVRLTDKYHIGSCTKSMTATLAAILIAEGKNTWDTTIGQVFEGFKIHPDYRKVSVRQLLTNTGGTPVDIDSILWSELWKAEGTLTDQRLQLLKGIISNPPKYPPGTKYEYSNAGYSIAGALLEKVTGDSFENLLKEKLFDPLGMSSAGFRAPAENGKVTQPYGHIKKWFRVTPTDAEPGGDNPAAIAPAGAVHSSVLDLARYAQFHLGTVGK
jgi:CubicO group peptidase (beta-lactamase class C family)